MAGAHVLGVELLGGFRLLTDGRVAPRLPTTRQQQLITFLLLHARSAPIQRQRIAGSLWPDSLDAQALTNLRRELHHLRESWPELDGCIDSGSRTLGWVGEKTCTVDVHAFEAAADRGLAGDRAALQDAAGLYRGDLLPDCSGEWIDADRERLRQRAIEVLRRLLVVLEQDRAFADAIERAGQLLRLDALDEDAWRTLMRCHARRGDRATALHCYQQCAALLKKELGIQPGPATRMTYREVLDADASSVAVPAPPRPAVYPLVGRSAEWHTVQQAWQRADGGAAHLLLVRGEAGIGKTRLVEELVDWCALHDVNAATARCYAGEGRLAYAPVAAWVKSVALRSTVVHMEAAVTREVARICPELLTTRTDVAALDGPIESWQRLQFFEALSTAFRAATPLALVVDDLQWADADTIEWLQYFLRAIRGARCLVVATARSGEEQDNPGLGRLIGHLERDGLLTLLSLGPLDEMSTAQLAGEIEEHPLDETASARAFRETEGHPLFIVERGRMAHASQPGVAGNPPLSQVQTVVAARLALLSAEARETAEVAAAVGRDFRFDILADVSDLEEDVLVRALDELWRRHIVRVQAEERWDFSHDRIREVAYGGIGPARRRLIHRRIAQAMERLFADRLDEVSAPIAMHFERGGQPARAVPFLERAAAVATRMSAGEEAIRCLSQALALLDRMPAGRERDEHELRLRADLSVPLNSARGYAAPEVEANLDRVFVLARAIDRGRIPVRWLWAAFTLRYMLGDVHRAYEVSELAIAGCALEPSCWCEAHHAMGGTLSAMGRLEESAHHFDAALQVYDERQPRRSALGSDLGVFGHAWYAHPLWLLGREDDALAHAEEAIALARRLGDLFSETLALAYACLLHQMRGDVAAVLRTGTAAVALCDRFGFAYYGDWAQVLIGWADGQTRPREGAAAIESALARLDASRAQARRPYYLSLLAELYGRLGDRARATAIVDSAIATALERSDVWWLPALYLQKSDVDAPADRERTVGMALDTARAQGNRALEQRILAALAGS